MSAMASQITSLTIVYSTVYSGTDEKTSTHRVAGLCEGDSTVTGEFPAKKFSNAENVSIWWRYHVCAVLLPEWLLPYQQVDISETYFEWSRFRNSDIFFYVNSTENIADHLFMLRDVYDAKLGRHYKKQIM